MAKKELLKISKSDRYQTVDELFEKSTPSSIYYTLLILSVFIVASGLLLDNAFIIIGGMLVTPLLTPILVIALGIVASQLGASKSATFLLLKSVLIVIAGSFILSLLFDVPERPILFDNTIRTAILYFIVAVASGIASTYAWVRKGAVEILPGIAIAMALVPPLSLIGIWLSTWNIPAVRFYFLVFLFNLFGIIVGSFIMFSLLKFYKVEEKVKQEHKEAQKEQEKNKKK